MISAIGSNENDVTLVGLSTDTKPLDKPNGAIFIEMDTGDVYLFDKQNKEWRLL